MSQLVPECPGGGVDVRHVPASRRWPSMSLALGQVGVGWGSWRSLQLGFKRLQISYPNVEISGMGWDGMGLGWGGANDVHFD